jgi:adenylosuccinate lyase
MPHKRNPVLSENITGLARMVRAYVTPALENVALWHERDISHSSVERMIAPDATVTLDFALARLTTIIDKLVVYPANMLKNLERLGGLIHSRTPTRWFSATPCGHGRAKAISSPCSWPITTCANI